MSYRHTLEAALESLHEIEDLVIGFPNSGKIPTLEIDLALQKLRNVYELMLMIREKDTNEPLVPEIKDNLEIKQVKSVETSNLTVTIEEENEVKLTETILEEETKTVKKTVIEKEIQTLSDQFKGRTTLLESMHQNFDENGTLAHAKPVGDLMVAIGINDRFTFIRELFNNNKKEFEATIAALNDAGSFNNALNHLITEFKWDMKSEPVQLLLGIIRRKYIK